MQLKTCPFCGGEAEIKNTKPNRPYWVVRCKECRAQTRTVKIQMWSNDKERLDRHILLAKEWAAEAWNRRQANE